MHPTLVVRARPAALVGLAFALAACNSSDSTGPTTSPDRIVLTAQQVQSLDSTVQVVVDANPGDPTLRSLVDSTIGALTAGVELKRVDVTTDFATGPLYFVAIHRQASYASGSWSTWTLIGIDDPSHLTKIIEVAGFAQSGDATPPVSLSGTIGDGTGFVNGRLIQVAAGGAATHWTADVGSASFLSDAPGAACPGFTPTAHNSCALETLHTHFTMSAPDTQGAGARQATLATDTVIPTMGLTFVP